MFKPILLGCAALVSASAADAATIVQTTFASSGSHGGTTTGSISQYDGQIWKVTIDITGAGGTSSDFVPIPPSEPLLSGALTVILGAIFSGPWTPGSATCGFGCQGSFSTSFSKSFSGSDLAAFVGTGSLTFDIYADVGTNFPYDSTAGYADATVTYYLGAPEPGAWAMMVVGFGLVGASLRHRGKVSGKLASTSI